MDCRGFRPSSLFLQGEVASRKSAIPNVWLNHIIEHEQSKAAFAFAVWRFTCAPFSSLCGWFP